MKSYYTGSSLNCGLSPPFFLSLFPNVSPTPPLSEGGSFVTPVCVARDLGVAMDSIYSQDDSPH